MATNVNSNNLDGDSRCSSGDGGNEEMGAGKSEWKNAKFHTNSSILRIGIGGMERRETDATFVDRCLSKFFRRIGIWIGQCRVPLVSIFLLISILFSSSFPFTPQQDDLKNGYTPNGAQSRLELAKYEQHFRPDSLSNFTTIGQKSEPISLLVFIQARDNGTLLRDSHLLEMVQLIDQLFNDFPLAGRSFAEFCTDFCQFNEPIRQFTNGFLIRQRQLGHEDRLNLSFPFMSILGHQIDLSPHFFDTKLDPQGQLIHFRLALLQFKADPQANVSRMELLQWERRIVHFLHKEYKGHLRPLAFTMSFVADEVIRTGMTLFPFLSVGFAIMCLFSVVTVSLSATYFRQFTYQKVLIAIIACCCPLLACSTALGLFFGMGLRFGTILCVSPFLVLAIGVDDAFLMLQSWQRICAEWESTKSKQSNDGDEAFNEKIGQMLEDVGPSITITSATNVLALCIGILTPTPEIQLFCTGTAAAILFDYIFQIFLFTPCLAIFGKYELQNEGRKSKGNDGKCWANWIHNFRIVFRQQLSAFMRAYCRWIANGFTCFFVSIFLIFYWIFSAKYASGVVPNITPRKLLLADSVLNEVVTLKDKFILPNYMPVSIFVENVGDLRDQRIDRIKSLIAEFENEPNNLGPSFTHFWLRDYEQFLNNEFVEEQAGEEMIGIEETESFIEKQNPFCRSQMVAFLEWSEYRHWNGFLRFRDDLLDRFFVITAFHGPELIEWNNRAKLLARWRQIVAKYGDDLDAFIWVEEAQFLDQIETLIPATIQSSIVTLICMSLICSLFMSNLWTVILATISIVSICLGAFGLLVVWGIGLDPISMATTIMSIGFSVDFPAHIAYHYYRHGKNNNNKSVECCPEERVQAALISIGFPLIQCGFSTIFFVLCLLFVDTYMSEVFVKTMFLVVSLGLIHGLFIVPTMLCAISKINSLLEWKKRTQHLASRRKNSIKNQKLERKGSSKLVVSIVGPG